MKIRSRWRVSLPVDVREALQVKEGDYLRFSKTDDGAIIIRPEKNALMGLTLKTPSVREP